MKDQMIARFNRDGYIIAISEEEKETATVLVQDGLLREAPKEYWVNDPQSPIFVHSSVDCKNKMPYSLSCFLREDKQWQSGDFLRLRIFTQSAKEIGIAHGTFISKVDDKNAEIRIFGIDRTITVPFSEIASIK